MVKYFQGKKTLKIQRQWKNLNAKSSSGRSHTGGLRSTSSSNRSFRIPQTAKIFSHYKRQQQIHSQVRPINGKPNPSQYLKKIQLSLTSALYKGRDHDVNESRGLHQENIAE